jgi:hypothetical protein
MAELLCKALSGPIPGDDDGKHFEIGKSYHFIEESCALVMRGSPGAFEIADGLVRVGSPDQVVNYGEPISEADGALGKGDSNGPTPPPPVEVDDEAEAEAARQKQIADDNARADAEQVEIDRQMEEKARSSNAARAAEADAVEELADVSDELAGMTVVQLKSFAKKRGIKVRISGVSRDKLRASIEKAIDDEAEGD